MSESGKETGFEPPQFMQTDNPTSDVEFARIQQMRDAAPALYEACADASFYLKALGARLAALDLDNTETYGCLKTASMFARTLEAALLLSNTGGTGNG